MNYLITGGAGFIGSNLVDRLLSEGHSIVCIDNFDDFYDPEIKKQNIRNASLSDKFRLVVGDIRDAEKLDECFIHLRVDTVIHLAAMAGVRPSIENPELYYQVNLLGTLKLLEKMKANGVKKMIFSSSSSVYGNNAKVPFSESDNVDNPISPYAASKKAAELLCFNYSHLYNFDISCLRFFTVYGPRQRPEMAIHLFTRNIDQNTQITLFGDGESKRDYTFIDDIIGGICGALRNNIGYRIINLGESSVISLNKLVELISKELKKTAILVYKPMQPGDVQITYADISKARDIINYAPTTQIEEGIKIFIKWYLNKDSN